MKIFLSFILKSISFVASIVTISSSIAPDITSDYVNKYLNIIIYPQAIISIGVITLSIPIIAGVINSKRHGGFKKLYNPKHILASILLSEFWYGFLYGIRRVGLFIIIIISFYFLYMKAGLNGIF